MLGSPRRVLFLVLGLVAFANLPALGRDFADLDDWTHLETSMGLVRGDVAAWQHVFTARTGVASVRPGSALSWAANFALFGFKPIGYFLTNLLLHLGITAAVFALVQRIAKSPAAAAVAATAVGLSASTNQPIYYLSGRDDLLANAAFLGAVLLWQTGRDTRVGRVGVAVLYAVGAACKPTILPLPALLILDDVLRDGRPALSPRTLLARYAPIGIVALSVLALLSGVLGTANPGSLLTPEQRQGLAAGRGFGRLAGRVGTSFFLPLFAKDSGVSSLVFDLPRLALIAVAVVSTRTRGAPRRLILLGAGWLVLNLAMPLPFVAMDSWRAQDAGRYLQLPLVGVALMLGAAFAGPATSRLHRALAPAVVLLTMLPFLMKVTPTLGNEGVGTERFVRAIAKAATGMPEGGRLIVAMRGPDQGLASLAASSILEERVPALRGKPYLFLEGSARLHRNTRRGAAYSYARFTALQDDFTLESLDTAGPDRLVAAQPGGGWSQVVLDESVFSHKSANELPSWVFRNGDTGGWTWRGVPPAMMRRAPRGAGLQVALPPVREGVGLELFVDGYLPPAVLDRAMSFLRVQPGHILSPPVDIVAASVCRLTVSVVLPDRVEPSYAESDFLVPSRRFALLGWSTEEGVPDAPFDHYLVVPLSEWPGPQSVSVALDNSPGWLAAGRIRRLAFLPANVPGPVDVGAIVLQRCD
jgi:hypothetical protein